MILQDVFLPDFIKVDLKAGDRDEAFRELVAHYCQADKSNAYEEILNAITARETKMSTGIYKGVAVPHGKTNAVKTLRGVIGISQKGVSYDALDGEPVYLLFMVLSPMEDSQEYLRLLKHLADIVELPDFKTELQMQKDSKNAFNVICKYENTVKN